MLSKARLDYPNLNFDYAELPDLPNYKNVNLYVLSEVLYYLNNPNRELLPSKISNSLEINGLVLFTARIGEKYFIEDSALKLLSKYFNIVNTNYIYCKFYTL